MRRITASSLSCPNVSGDGSDNPNSTVEPEIEETVTCPLLTQNQEKTNSSR